MEEIDLSTDEDITQFTDEEQVSVDKINHEFRQESKLKGMVREFTLFNDIQCYQRVTRKHGGKTKFRINLTFLDPQPKRKFILADNWLMTAAISLVLCFLLIYVGWFSEMQFNNLGITVVTALCISFCCIAFMVALLKTQDRIHFYSKFGHAPILELINHNPNRESFQTFMDTISSSIIKAQHSSGLTPTETLVLELKELRRLKDEKVLAESIYEIAKKDILGNKAFISSNNP